MRCPVCGAEPDVRRSAGVQEGPEPPKVHIRVRHACSDGREYAGESRVVANAEKAFVMSVLPKEGSSE